MQCQYQCYNSICQKNVINWGGGGRACAYILRKWYVTVKTLHTNFACKFSGKRSSLFNTCVCKGPQDNDCITWATYDFVYRLSVVPSFICSSGFFFPKILTRVRLFPNYRPHPKDGGRYCFSVCLSVHISGGRGWFPGPGGGGPRSRSGGVPGPGGGVPGPRSGGGVPGLSKEKNFWHQIWLDTCSDWKKNFCRGTPPPPPTVKGKNFDTRFGLIHVQTGKKNFCWGDPPPSKGKIFWHQIWLDTCSDWEKKFCRGNPPPPPPVKGKIFDTRFGLIHVQTEKKNFCWGTPPPARNSKDLLWLRGGRYASCVHAGGLSCFQDKFESSFSYWPDRFFPNCTRLSARNFSGNYSWFVGLFATKCC